MPEQFASPLPEFDRPPVSEVALSIEFLPLQGWRTPHSGLYWGRLQAQYPHTEVHPPLASQIEKYGEEFWQQPMIRVEVVNPDISRFWFLDDTRTRLIQVQRDRFIVNWRKVRGDEIYPRYEDDLRPRLEREWGRFKQFVADSHIGDIAVQQCEVTYVNDMPAGDEWRTFAESLRLFSPWWGRGSDGFLQRPETLMVQGSFALGGEEGRLHFVSRHVRRNLDQKEAVQLMLTARGRPKSSADADVLGFMDIGREWVVRAFADLTSAEAHKFWKRIR